VLTLGAGIASAWYFAADEPSCACVCGVRVFAGRPRGTSRTSSGRATGCT